MFTPEELNHAEKSWSNISGTDQYKVMSTEDQQATQDIFKSKVPAGTKILNDLSGANKGFGHNMWDQGKESVLAAIDAVQLSDDVATGNIDENTSSNLAKSIKRSSEQHTPPELSAFQKVLSRATEEYKKAYTPAEIASSVGSGVWDTVKELVTNPKGAALLAAGSAGYSVPPIMGAISGAAATGAIPIPHVKAAGAFIGAAGGGYSSEAGARLKEEVDKKLTLLNLPATKENIDNLWQDTEFKEDAFSKANSKALGTGLTDAVLGIGVAKIAEIPFRAASKQASMKLGPHATKEALAVETSKIMSARSVPDRLASNAKAYGAEIATEPISEGAGQLVSDGTLDLGGLLGEAVGAIVTSTVSAPADIYAFGSETPAVKSKLNAVAETIKDKLAPKSEERLATEKVNQGQAAPGFNDNLAAATETGDVTNYADPEHAEYQPILAVKALSAINQKADTTPADKINNLNKALDIQNTFGEAVFAMAEKKLELTEKKAAGTELTPAETKQLDDINKTAKGTIETRNTIDSMVTAMHSTKLTSEELKAKLTSVSESNDPDEIDATVNALFTGNGARDSITFGSSLAAIQSNPATTPETKAFVAKLQTYHSMEQKLSELTGKSTDDVNKDILVSGGGNKGISSYYQNIASALQHNDVELAQSEFDGLSKFAGDQQRKATTLRSMNNSKAKGIAYSTADVANLAIVNASQLKKGKPYAITNPHAPKWLHTIDTMEAESTALNQAVSIAKDMFTRAGKGATVEAPVAPVTKTPVQSTASTPAAVKQAPVVKQITPEAVTALFADESIEDAKGDKAKGIISLVQSGKTTPETLSNLLDVGYNRAARIGEKINDPSLVKPVPPPKTEIKPKESSTIEKPVGTKEQKVEAHPVDTKPVVDQKPETVSPKVEPKKQAPINVIVNPNNAVALSEINVNITKKLTTGEEHTFKFNADEAMDDIDTEIKLYEKILACVS